MSEALTFQLVEGHLKKVKIFEGQMKRPTFRIKFKGNNPNYGANIAYYYNGKCNLKQPLINQFIQLFYIFCLMTVFVVCFGSININGCLGFLNRLHGSGAGYTTAWTCHSL